MKNTEHKKRVINNPNIKISDIKSADDFALEMGVSAVYVRQQIREGFVDVVKIGKFIFIIDNEKNRRLFEKKSK